jgi:hypothetical protein
MNKGLFFGLVLAAVPVLWPLPMARQQGAADPPKKPELASLVVRVADKETGKAVSGADITVAWGDADDSDTKDKSTLADGTAKFKDIPRMKVKIQVVAKKYETFGCFLELKKAEESIDIKLQKSGTAAAQDPSSTPHSR